MKIMTEMNEKRKAISPVINRYINIYVMYINSRIQVKVPLNEPLSKSFERVSKNLLCTSFFTLLLR